MFMFYSPGIGWVLEFVVSMSEIGREISLFLGSSASNLIFQDKKTLRVSGDLGKRPQFVFGKAGSYKFQGFVRKSSFLAGSRSVSGGVVGRGQSEALRVPFSFFKEGQGGRGQQELCKGYFNSVETCYPPADIVSSLSKSNQLVIKLGSYSEDDVVFGGFVVFVSV